LTPMTNYDINALSKLCLKCVCVICVDTLIVHHEMIIM